MGGQVQVVTKSGTQSFHGSGYWYGRRSGWDANTWTNKREAAPPPIGSGQLIELPEASRNDFGYTIGGPIYIPGKFNQDKKKLFFFWSQEWQKRKDSVAERLARVPTELERRGDFSQSVDSSGNPWPYIRDWTTGLPCNASDTRGCFRDGGVLGRIPQDRLWQPGLNALSIYPLPNTTGSSGINYRSQTPNDIPRREEMLRLDFQATDKWRFMGRYMRNKDTKDEAYGGILMGSNLDTVHSVLDIPGSNWALSATGVLNTTTSIEINIGSAHNEILVASENPALRRSAAGVADFPLLYPGAVQQDYIPYFYFRGGRVGSSAAYIVTSFSPFRNENTTYDVLANLTKIRGSHTFKAGVYFQHSYKAQSDFATHNSLINFVDDASNPYDTGFGYANAAIGVFSNYAQASKYAMAEWVYDNFEFYVQDNWKVTRRLTLDYGVRFYYLTPTWDQTLQASTFLPDRFSTANAARLYSPVCLGSYPCSGSARRGMDPALVDAGVTPTPGNTVDGRFIGRLVPGSDRFNGAFQAGQGIDDTMQSGNAFRVSPRIGVVYDLRGEGKTIVRGGFGIFYDRPQGQHGVLPDRERPGHAATAPAVGAPPGRLRLPGRPRSHPPDVPDGVRLRAAARDGLERGRAAQAGAQHRVRPRLRGFLVEGPPAVVADQRDPLGGQVPAGEPGPHPRAERHAGGDRPAGRLAATVLRLQPDLPLGVWGDLQLPRPADIPQPPLRQRADVLGLLRLEQGPRHGRQRRLPRAPERHRGGEPPRQLLLRRLRPAPHLRGQLHLPDAQGREGRARPPRQRLADLRRLPLDERYPVPGQLLRPRHRERQPHRVRPARPHRGHLRPGQGLE